MKTIKFDETKVYSCVGVDAGLLMLGDPCYHLHKSPHADQPHERLDRFFGTSWHEFLANFRRIESPSGVTHAECASGANGLTTVISHFGGDGVYPIYATHDEHGRLAQVIIDFQAD